MTLEEFFELLNNEHLQHHIKAYKNDSWKIVVQLPFIKHTLYPMLEKWCEENCEGKYVVHNECYVLFELESDAMAFKLRWT